MYKHITFHNNFFAIIKQIITRQRNIRVEQRF